MVSKVFQKAGIVPMGEKHTLDVGDTVRLNTFWAKGKRGEHLWEIKFKSNFIGTFLYLGPRHKEEEELDIDEVLSSLGYIKLQPIDLQEILATETAGVE